MKIVFKEDYNGVGRNFKAGKEYTVNDAKAAIYVKSGLAKPADAEARHAVEATTQADDAAGKGKK